MAAAYAEPEQVVNYYYGNSEQLTAIEGAVVEDQLVDWLLEQGQVTEKVAEFDAVMADTVVPKPEPEEGGAEEEAAG